MFEQSLYGAVQVIGPSDPIVESTIEEFELIAEGLLRAGQPLAILDLSKTPMIDSAGLEAILDVKDAFEQRGGKFKLAGPANLCRDILEVSGVGKSFEVFKSVAEAVGSFSR